MHVERLPEHGQHRGKESDQGSIKAHVEEEDFRCGKDRQEHKHDCMINEGFISVDISLRSADDAR